MAVGNTFGATALSSYGGFWISFAIVLTPGGFDIVAAYETDTAGKNDFTNAFGFFLIGWFIFTSILLICTLRSTVAFFLLFFFLDMAFLLLGIGYLQATDGAPKVSVIKAGGYFGLFAAFMAWYNALAGIADSRYVFPSKSLSDLSAQPKLTHLLNSNSFFVIPVAHFPWSDKGREARGVSKTEEQMA
jgi:succinate-acetate transporter protein